MPLYEMETVDKYIPIHFTPSQMIDEIYGEVEVNVDELNTVPSFENEKFGRARLDTTIDLFCINGPKVYT
jgi:hypothetical protein